ncbi:MAG: SCP2 domain-containing protein [Burkholderiales bacterium]
MPKATPAVAFCFVLNQLLAREHWARGRLARFSGQALELRLPLAPQLRIAITPDGALEPGGPEPTALMTLAGIDGTSELAEELRFLVRHLRWDAEEELAHLVGDVAAHRVAMGLRALARWQRDAGQRLAEGLADYAVDERRALVRRVELRQLAADIERLAKQLAALEQRTGRLV